ncbi:hypothetical protein [Longimicrobium sp.]|uniref:hypothetical protein n=1 Tax=Longimicrobium sp. TaxID=2029185 RepID=UPI003B3B93CE
MRPSDSPTACRRLRASAGNRPTRLGTSTLGGPLLTSSSTIPPTGAGFPAAGSVPMSEFCSLRCCMRRTAS